MEYCLVVINSVITSAQQIPSTKYSIIGHFSRNFFTLLQVSFILSLTFYSSSKYLKRNKDWRVFKLVLSPGRSNTILKTLVKPAQIQGDEQELGLV